MSLVHVAQAAASATSSPSVSPSLSPSASPVVHAAVASPDFLAQAASYIGAHQVEFVVLLAAVLVVAQNLINRLPWLKGEEDAASQKLQDIKREVLALGLPALVLAIGSVLQGTNLMAYWLELWAVAKAVFNVWKLAVVSAQKTQAVPLQATESVESVG